jgi:hypothetical protein
VLCSVTKGTHILRLMRVLSEERSVLATLDGVIIADKGSAFDSGIALLLQQECPVNEVVSIDPMWEVEVRSGSAYVVARTKGVGGNSQASREDQKASETFNYAYESAQKGLVFSPSLETQICQSATLWMRAWSGGAKTRYKC